MGPPPLETTATSLFSTWRCAASPRNCRQASCNTQFPCIRPAESCPPYVLSGRAALQGDASGTLDEGPCLAVTAETQCLQPGDRQEGEAVVELRHIDVRWFEVGTAPHFGRGFDRRHLRVVRPLVPSPQSERSAARLDPDGVVAIGCGVGRRDDEGDRTVDRDVAIEETEGVRDHPGRQVVVHGERVAERRPGIQRRVPPAVDSQPAELLFCRAVEVHVTAGVEGEPIGGRIGVSGEKPGYISHRSLPRLRRGWAQRPKMGTVGPLRRRSRFWWWWCLVAATPSPPSC